MQQGYVLSTTEWLTIIGILATTSCFLLGGLIHAVSLLTQIKASLDTHKADIDQLKIDRNKHSETIGKHSTDIAIIKTSLKLE